MKKVSSIHGLTFDDVLILPRFSSFERNTISLTTRLSKKMKLAVPLIASPMDTVTEHKLAIELAKIGGIGIIHRNLTVNNQADEIQKVVKKKLLVGAAVGVSQGYKERVKALINAGVHLLVLDSAHGHTLKMVQAITYLKGSFSHIDVMAGNIATYGAAIAMINAGADSLRVGMGPGAICTTRIISGMGVPQITALLETTRAAKKTKTPIIADGGIKYSGDMVKALAAGASACMLGSFFASCLESPGKIYNLSASQIPSRFKNMTNGKNFNKKYQFKSYRGMGSIGAMKTGEKIKSEDEFHGKNYNDRILVAEGVEGLVPVNGTVKDVVDQAVGGIKSGLYYAGAQSISTLHSAAQLIQITHASLTESHPHDIFVTNPGENYV